VAGADDGLREIVAPPDLAVVLDHHPGRLHIQLLEQVKQAHALDDPTRLAVEGHRYIGHRRATSSRVTIRPASRRAAAAGSPASQTARTTASACAPASTTAAALSWSIPPTATNGRSMTPATRETRAVPTAGLPSFVGVG